MTSVANQGCCVSSLAVHRQHFLCVQNPLLVAPISCVPSCDADAKCLPSPHVCPNDFTAKLLQRVPVFREVLTQELVLAAANLRQDMSTQSWRSLPQAVRTMFFKMRCYPFISLGSLVALAQFSCDSLGVDINKHVHVRVQRRMFLRESRHFHYCQNHF